MRAWAVVLLLSGAAAAQQAAQASSPFGAAAEARFARLALECVHKEYPNKIAHVLNSDADVQPPRKLTPAFYGCYDWHSSVHGHWLLARLARLHPGAPYAPPAIASLRQSLTPANIAAEAEYLKGAGRASFERPYGLAWLLQLAQELREWDSPAGQQMAADLRPLEAAALERLNTWLPKLPHAVRSGEHSQTAFALGLMLDYARAAGDRSFAELLKQRATVFYSADRNCPLAYEPSGEDFLSPCLAEADVMRRILAPAEYAEWLSAFMPQIPRGSSRRWLAPAVSPDPSDPKLAHLDGLNLSRAWMLEGIASGLPAGDKRIVALRAAAEAHSQAGLTAVTGAHYEGGHWLGSFATYLITRRGIEQK